jgi:lactam utilization protein B
MEGLRQPQEKEEERGRRREGALVTRREVRAKHCKVEGQKNQALRTVRQTTMKNAPHIIESFTTFEIS